MTKQPDQATAAAAAAAAAPATVAAVYARPRQVVDRHYPPAAEQWILGSSVGVCGD